MQESRRGCYGLGGRPEPPDARQGTRQRQRKDVTLDCKQQSNIQRIWTASKGAAQ